MVKIPTGDNKQFVVLDKNSIESVSRISPKYSTIRTKSGVTHKIFLSAETVLKSLDIKADELADEKGKKPETSKK